MNKINMFCDDAMFTNLERRMERYKKSNETLNAVITMLTILLIVLSIIMSIFIFKYYVVKEQLETVMNAKIEVEEKYYTLLDVHQQEIDKIQKDFNEDKKQLEDKYISIFKTSKDYTALVNTMQGEAANQGVDGIKHCVSVVMNRVADPRFPNNIYDVVSAPGQFDAYGQKWKTINPDVYTAVDDVLFADASVNDAIYYMNPVYSGALSRSWMRTKSHVVTFKDHEFYK